MAPVVHTALLFRLDGRQPLSQLSGGARRVHRSVDGGQEERVLLLVALLHDGQCEVACDEVEVSHARVVRRPSLSRGERVNDRGGSAAPLGAASGGRDGRRGGWIGWDVARGRRLGSGAIGRLLRVLGRLGALTALGSVARCRRLCGPVPLAMPLLARRGGGTGRDRHWQGGGTGRCRNRARVLGCG